MESAVTLADAFGSSSNVNYSGQAVISCAPLLGRGAHVERIGALWNLAVLFRVHARRKTRTDAERCFARSADMHKQKN
jgi:hypothetical protein